MTAPEASGDITEDRALGGRLTLRQPRRGHRFGHDAILLAAATAPRDGQVEGQVFVEFGAGVGAAGLALAHRVPGLAIVLAEIDPSLVALAQDNAARNGMEACARAVACDVTAADLAARLGLAPASVDGVLMNPPFNDPARQNLSPDAARRLAHAGDAQTLRHWCAAAARLLKAGGVLTLIWRAEEQDAVSAALARDFGGVALREIYPRAGKPAIRLLARAVRGGEATAAINLPPLTLADADGKPSQAAEAVLRHGMALPFVS